MRSESKSRPQLLGEEIVYYSGEHEFINQASGQRHISDPNFCKRYWFDHVRHCLENAGYHQSPAQNARGMNIWMSGFRMRLVGSGVIRVAETDMVHV